jgi:hypothetical protein
MDAVRRAEDLELTVVVKGEPVLEDGHSEVGRHLLGLGVSVRPPHVPCNTIVVRWKTVATVGPRGGRRRCEALDSSFFDDICDGNGSDPSTANSQSSTREEQ